MSCCLVPATCKTRDVLISALQKSAIVVFDSASSVKKAVKTAAAGKAVTVLFQEPQEAFGLKGEVLILSQHSTNVWHPLHLQKTPLNSNCCAGWVEQHKAKTPGNTILQQQLDEWMEQWEASEKQRRETDAAAAADEGWTVVTKQRVSSALLPAFVIHFKIHLNSLTANMAFL